MWTYYLWKRRHGKERLKGNEIKDIWVLSLFFWVDKVIVLPYQPLHIHFQNYVKKSIYMKLGFKIKVIYSLQH